MFSWLWGSRAVVVSETKPLPAEKLQALDEAAKPVSSELKSESHEDHHDVIAHGEEEWTLLSDGQQVLEDVSEAEHAKAEAQRKLIAEQEAEAELQRLAQIQDLFSEDVDVLQQQFSTTVSRPVSPVREQTPSPSVVIDIREEDLSAEESCGSEYDVHSPLMPKQPAIEYVFPPPGNRPRMSQQSAQSPAAILPPTPVLPFSSTAALCLQMLNHIHQSAAIDEKELEFKETRHPRKRERDDGVTRVIQISSRPLSGWDRILRPHVEPVPQPFVLPNVPFSTPVDTSDDAPCRARSMRS